MDISIIPDYINTKEEVVTWLHKHGWGNYQAQQLAAKWDEGIPLPASILGMPKPLEETKKTIVSAAPAKKVVVAPVKKI